LEHLETAKIVIGENDTFAESIDRLPVLNKGYNAKISCLNCFYQ